MSEVLEVAIDLIEQVTDVPADEIDGASRFEALDNWTSFAALQLLVAIEERFGVRLDLRSYLAWSRVDELAAGIATALDADVAAA